MTDPMPADLLRAGDLPGLRALFAARVRAEPGQAAHRVDMADVLIVAGDLERADTHLSLASDQDTSLGLAVALTRQLLRAATARIETFEQRRPPELVTEADPAITAALAILAGVGDAEPASDAAELGGTLNGERFTGLRDGDGRTPTVLEILTSTGKYCWVSFADIASLKVQKAERLRDLVWRPAELEVRGGPTGIVYLPAIYHAAADEMTDAHRLGRATDWVEEGETVRGLGLRTWLVGEEAVTLDDVVELAVGAD